MIVREIFRNFVRGAFKVLELDSPYSAKEYGPNWRKQRKKCLERDEYACRICGVEQADLDTELSVHHIRPRVEYDGNWEQNELSNLIAVCPSCHGKVEGKYQGMSPTEFAAKAQQEV